MHLAARFPGAGTTVWSDPLAGSPVDFASFEHFARTAERGLFDFLLLAEGLRLREHRGRIHDPDAVGRPDPLTVLAALAAVTDRIGLAATAGTTFNEPYELARRLASLDHLSGGRAAWHVATCADSFTGENFRRGGFLDRTGLPRVPDPARTGDTPLARAAEFVRAARRLWDSWTPDGRQRPFAHRGRHFDIAGGFTVPRCPQGSPVVIQAGDSPESRESAACTADVLLTPHGPLAAGRERYADVKDRLARYGRTHEDLKVLSGVTFVLGATAAEARERAAGIRRRQISPRAAIVAMERVWGVDLSSWDPDGPLPDFDPEPAGAVSWERCGSADPAAVAHRWRAVSREKGLSIRETVIETADRPAFVGTPEAVAAELDAYVRQRACDGFVLVPHLAPGGLDEFVERVVPLLRERGVLRTRYTGTTLRSHLGLPEPAPGTALPAAGAGRTEQEQAGTPP
ncbi:NtaA/DmoA family FMN-dependent monooxygenase [Streptomyces sulfonofaciens]|nr:NtaA/DmoA family FMN-dependent monooxygenase [Streptomyces sulfonofaciens]